VRFGLEVSKSKENAGSSISRDSTFSDNAVLENFISTIRFKIDSRTRRGSARVVNLRVFYQQVSGGNYTDPLTMVVLQKYILHLYVFTVRVFSFTPADVNPVSPAASDSQSFDQDVAATSD
jgi:hypothetical protein